jgi:hypothetical protein
MIELLIEARWLDPEQADDKRKIAKALDDMARATLRNR